MQSDTAMRNKYYFFQINTCNYLQNSGDAVMVIYYLFWDWEAYQNLQNQNYLAGVIANAMNANMLYPIQLDNQEKS